MYQRLREDVLVLRRSGLWGCGLLMRVGSEWGCTGVGVGYEGLAGLGDSMGNGVTHPTGLHGLKPILPWWVAVFFYKNVVTYWFLAQLYM